MEYLPTWWPLALPLALPVIWIVWGLLEKLCRKWKESKQQISDVWIEDPEQEFWFTCPSGGGRWHFGPHQAIEYAQKCSSCGKTHTFTHQARRLAEMRINEEYNERSRLNDRMSVTWNGYNRDRKDWRNMTCPVCTHDVPNPFHPEDYQMELTEESILANEMTCPLCGEKSALDWEPKTAKERKACIKTMHEQAAKWKKREEKERQKKEEQQKMYDKFFEETIQVVLHSHDECTDYPSHLVKCPCCGASARKHEHLVKSFIRDGNSDQLKKWVYIPNYRTCK